MSEGRISRAQKEAEGPSGDSHTSTESVFHSDDLTSSSSSLEILSRRLLAPLQRVKKQQHTQLFDKGSTGLCFSKGFFLFNDKKHLQILLKWWFVHRHEFVLHAV